MSSSSLRSAFSHLSLRRDFSTELHVVKINAKFSRSRLRAVVQSMNVQVPGKRYFNLDASHFAPELFETSCVLLSLEPPLRSYLFIFDADRRRHADPFLLWVIWGTSERDFQNFCMVVRNRKNIVQVRVGFGDDVECFIPNFNLYLAGKKPRAFDSFQRYLYDRDLTYLATPLWVVLGSAWRDSNLTVLTHDYNAQDNSPSSAGGVCNPFTRGSEADAADLKSLFSETMSTYSTSSDWAFVDHADAIPMVNLHQMGLNNDVSPLEEDQRSHFASLDMAELQFALDHGAFEE